MNFPRRVYDEHGRLVDLILDEDPALEAAATPLTDDPELRRPYYGRRHGMPAGMDGSPLARGAEFASPEEAAEYSVMQRDPETGEPLPSQFSQDMYDAHGMVQIATPDGPAFSMGTTVGGDMRDGLMDPRAMRMDQMRDSGMWTTEMARTPTGEEVERFVPSPDSRARDAARNEQRQLRDHARRMERQMRRGDPSVTQEDVDAAVAGTPTTQLERYNAQMMARARADGRVQARMAEEGKFAHGRHNINAGNADAIRDLIDLRRRNPEAYDELAADNMGPRNFTYRFNPRTGQIEASSTRAYEPPDRGADTQVNVNPMQEQAMDERRRQTNPTAAGGDDMRRGEFASAEASMLLDTLAERFDTTTGGFSYDNENQLAQHLVTEYGVPQEEAARLARRAANKRRRFWTTWFQPPPGQTPGSAPAGDSPPSTPGRSRTRRSGPAPRG